MLAFICLLVGVVVGMPIGAILYADLMMVVLRPWTAQRRKTLPVAYTRREQRRLRDNKADLRAAISRMRAS